MSHPPKAYKNHDFLSSTQARHIRIMCEYDEPRHRFRNLKVEDTIVMFGSARIPSGEVARQRLDVAQHEYDNALSPKEKEMLGHQLQKAHVNVRMSRFYDDCRELSRRLTEWGMKSPKGKNYLVTTGGGPGIMEAGNRGASDVPGGRSVGLGISLPFEERLNPYVTPELGFEFHYFFMRKYWFMYLAKAMVIFPGGFGTIDEMAELLTLLQTKKIKKKVPIVLYGHDYWGRVLDIEAMVEFGTISEKDLLLMHRSDNVDDAFNYLTAALTGPDQG